MIKAITAWAAAIFASAWDGAAQLFQWHWAIFTTLPWDKFAQFAAFIYSCCLIWEFLRKRSKKDKVNGPEQNLS